MSQLVLPAALLAGLTILMYFAQAFGATRAITSGSIPRSAVVYPGSQQYPDWLERLRRNYLNLLEMPLLFYAAIAFSLAGGGGDSFQLTLAWAYALLRVAHSAVHVIANPVLIRFIVFSLSAIVLAVMWARLALLAL